MPTYVYKCADCGHQFEAVQGFHDDPHDTCPDCGGKVRRVIGNVGVTFKGSGFYRTDSRTDKKKSSSAGSEKKSDTSKTTASESSKPAAKESTSGPKPSSSTS